MRHDPADDLTPDVRAILDRFVLHDIVSHLLRRAHFAAEERFAREFSDEQITPRQKATLIAVYQRPGVSQKMLAEHLFMDRVTVAEMVNRLVARRLLERRPSAEDQRAYELFLGAEGAAMLNRVMPRDALVERAILRPLSKENEELFKSCLRSILRASQS
ncbi:MAG: MarR family transcriptional regulator [Proteobacteria bacterium SG_bin9]|nr:MAG: MarR family transcriptional regulator [Proteobacteria bacterium SG_bin9]